ncbi:MAG: F0F1 ATP synthase subunit A [Chthoniobacterales bacterium]|nr:F0F1 ATP synthase subunit A [Chthoniobacterales bacterium]
MTALFPPVATALAAEKLPFGQIGEAEWLTNSILVAAIVVGVVWFFARRATRDIKLVPDGPQNAFEAVLEMLYDTLAEIVGPKMVKKVFSLLATLFLFILTANWFGLLPGVGSVGFGTKTGFLTVSEVSEPLLRPATADLNMTLAMALVFMVMWLYWSLQEMGLGGFLKHMFGVKGGLKGVMALSLAPIFFLVGLLEVVSIAFRPVSLSLRLFGNVFAGEVLLTTMLTLGKTLGFPDFVAYLSSIIIPIPFYFLELLVGLLQAFVFTLLCAVYVALSTSHDEEEHDEAHGEPHHA